MKIFIVTALATLWSAIIAKDLSEIETLVAKPTRCSYERAFDMYGAHCVGLKLTKLPSLKGGIEILDLTDNKLKELSANSFSSYTSIRFLYLADNSIYSVHEDTFSPLTSLETLDLSMNVIQHLPPSLLNLASLRNLYLSGNPLSNLDVEIKAIPKPIKAPLEQLDLSNCRLFNLPDFGVLPQLKMYNISHNPLQALEPSQFANACNLAKVDLTESIQFMKICKLRPAVKWFQDKHIFIGMTDYTELNSVAFSKCSVKEFPASLNATYQMCKSEYLQVQSVKTSKNRWLTIGGGLAGFLVGFILLLYVIHRRNVAHTRKAMKKDLKKPGERHTTETLLNNVS